MVVPAATPGDIVPWMNAAVARVPKMPDVRGRLPGKANEPVGGAPEQFGALVRSERAKEAKVITEAGITAE